MWDLHRRASSYVPAAMLLCFSLACLTLLAPGTACPAHEVVLPCDVPKSGRPWVLQEDCLLGSGTETVSIKSRSINVPPGKRLVIDLQSQLHIETQLLRLDGELWVGCVQDAFVGDFQLQLSKASEDELETFDYSHAGFPDFPPLPLSRALFVSNTGRLELHGKPKLSWTYLATSADAGSRRIQLEVPTGWQSGDEILMAPTGPSAASTSASTFETHRIAKVSASSRDLLLQTPLTTEHLGTFRGAGRRLNGAVALLGRNLRISGGALPWERCRQVLQRTAVHLTETEPPKECHGGHVLFIQNSTVNIEHVEFVHLGQAMQMARYPVHWHLAGDVRGRATLRNSSLHHNFQRCVTLHGTANAEVQQNVCYETFGHAFYLEDGIETGNVFEKNLVASIRPGGSVCSDWQVASGPRSNLQLGPSGFWITNPNNSFIENHVVDANTGYWFTFLHSKNGASGRYFKDPRSGQGPTSWWFQQEQARTPVRAFRGNAVTLARRGIHIDGRVTGSEDEGNAGTCRADHCATCSGPLEGSFSWIPMNFDIQQPKEQRTYLFQTNVFEDFSAAHIDGPISSEARAVWSSGGYIHFLRAILYNVRVAAAGMPDLSSGCFRLLDASPPGFVMAFTESLFISGPFSETFFQLYDGGIQVLHSRWIFGEGTKKDFAVAKPKCAFGGNGNPVYLLGSRPLLPKEAADSQLFAWAKGLIPPDHGLSISRPDSFHSHLGNFQCMAWASPYINGSYLYSADGLGDGIPTILAPLQEAVDGMQRIRGEEQCATFLQRTAPRFFCGPAFGSYGLSCGSRPWPQCPGAVAASARWMLQLEPWRSRGSWEAPETWETGPVSPSGPMVGHCVFSTAPPSSTPYVWDESCRNGGLGCYADGRHLQCRWCGFDPYPSCPKRSSQGDLWAAIVAFLVGFLLLLLILFVCWHCTVRGFAHRSEPLRPVAASAQPAAPLNSWQPPAAPPHPPHLLGRVAPQPKSLGKKPEVP